ncbi:XkdF-like putative serine protease domain-containing protein [bacterium]|nr:XkdF-like putative serine protease domain-containing protein [bacterium]
MNIQKNEKKRLARFGVLTPGLLDKDKHFIPNTEEGIDAIIDAEIDFAKGGSNLDLFHRDDMILSKQDAIVVEMWITENDMIVDLEKGEVMPDAVVMAKDVEGILQKSEGEIGLDVEMDLATEVFRNKYKEYKSIKNRIKEDLELHKKDPNHKFKYKKIRKGTLRMGVHYPNENIWNKVLDGTLGQVSIKGVATEFEEVDL